MKQTLFGLALVLATGAAAAQQQEDRERPRASIPLDANGGFALSLNLPTGTMGEAVYLQALVADGGALGGASATQGLVVVLP